MDRNIIKILPLVLFQIIWFPGNSLAANEITAVVKVDELEVWTQNNDQSEKIMQNLSRGNIVSILRCESDWCLLGADGTAAGWVKKDDLDVFVALDKWGPIPYSMFKAAENTCGEGNAAECMCHDGPSIGACGD